MTRHSDGRRFKIESMTRLVDQSWRAEKRAWSKMTRMTRMARARKVGDGGVLRGRQQMKKTMTVTQRIEQKPRHTEWISASATCQMPRGSLTSKKVHEELAEKMVAVLGQDVLSITLKPSGSHDAIQSTPRSDVELLTDLLRVELVERDLLEKVRVVFCLGARGTSGRVALLGVRDFDRKCTKPDGQRLVGGTSHVHVGGEG
jgi:hypothetical protein